MYICIQLSAGVESALSEIQGPRLEGVVGQGGLGAVAPLPGAADRPGHVAQGGLRWVEAGLAGAEAEIYEL